MDDRKIDTLLTTVRKGSFSKAAEDLNCTQSAVTQAMNALEAELGFKILERTHNGIHLTANGEKIMPSILEAEAILKKLAEEAAAISSGKSSPIRIGAFSSIADTWLSDIILAYRKENPAAEFSISIGTKDLIRWFINDEIDIALGDEEMIKAFRWYPLVNEKYLAVMTDDMISPDISSISQESFAEFTLLLPAAMDVDKKLNVVSERTIPVTADNDATLVNMVARGLGVTILPELSLKSISSIPENIVFLDLEPAPLRTLGLGVSNNPTKAISEFASFLRKSME